MNAILQSDFDSIARKLPKSIDRLSGKVVLITGARGLIGSYLCHLLAWWNDCLETPCTIVAVDSGIASGSGRNLPKSAFVGLWPVDVADFKPARADFILHAASIASPRFYKRYPIETLRGTTQVLWNLLDFASSNSVESFVYFSSSEVYGEPEVLPTSEKYVGRLQTMGSRSCYDLSKALGETLCHVYHEQHGVPVKVIRPSNVYGPGHNLDDGRIVPQLMKSAIRQEPLKLYGDGEATRSFCYLSDAVIQILYVLLNGENGQAYNVGNQKTEISMRALAELAREVIPIPSVERIDNPTAMEDAPGRRCPDMKKTYGLRCPTASVELSDGLRKTFEWHSMRSAALTSID